MKRLFLLIIAALMMTAQRAWADYVTDIVVIGHDSGKQIGYLYDNYKGAGWIGIDRDLNDGAGGHYIYQVYKTPQNSGTPITDLFLRVSWSNDSPASFVHNGRTYYRAGADGDSRFITSGGDLNCGADGAWIHLYYTKDNCKPNHLVTEITVDGNEDGAVRRNNEADACDLIAVNALNELLQSLDAAVEPIFRVLLRPACLREIYGVRLRNCSDDLSAALHQKQLDC